MMADEDRRAVGAGSEPTPPVYKRWALIVRAVVLAAIITGAVYFAAAGIVDWWGAPRP